MSPMRTAAAVLILLKLGLILVYIVLGDRDVTLSVYFITNVSLEISVAAIFLLSRKRRDLFGSPWSYALVIAFLLGDISFFVNSVQAVWISDDLLVNVILAFSTTLFLWPIILIVLLASRNQRGYASEPAVSYPL